MYRRHVPHPYLAGFNLLEAIGQIGAIIGAGILMTNGLVLLPLAMIGLAATEMALHLLSAYHLI